jgi:hypothetical protein
MSKWTVLGASLLWMSVASTAWASVAHASDAADSATTTAEIRSGTSAEVEVTSWRLDLLGKRAKRSG